MGRKKAIILGVAIPFMAFYLISSSQTTSSYDWKKLEETWKSFAANPTDEGLNALLLIVPQSGKVGDNTSNGAQIIEQIVRGLGVLENLVYEKNQNAVSLTFRFFTISFGNFEERLYKILGNLIGFDVNLFLLELQNNRILIPNIEDLLSSYKQNKDTSLDEQETERKYRIKILEGVSDKALKDLRNECLKILKKLASQ